jgi:hypothetical protein
MAQWQNIATNIPEDGAIVWIRFYVTAAPPIQVRWYQEEQLFETTDTYLRVPWYMISRWKAIE